MADERFAARDMRRARYSTGAIVLHWVIAALILANFLIALRFEALKGLALFELMQWHKSIGITVLVLSVGRLAWRLSNRPPSGESMPVWERRAAAGTHWLFYALMIGLPLTGWVVVSASPFNIPTLLYKTIPWPHIGFVHDLSPTARKGIEGRAAELHEWLAWGGAALLVLHVAAALRHHFVKRDLVLWSMVPVRLLRSRAILTKE